LHGTLDKKQYKLILSSVLKHRVALMELNFSRLVPRTTNSAWRYSTDFWTACRFHSYIHLSEWLHNVWTAGKRLQIYCIYMSQCAQDSHGKMHVWLAHTCAWSFKRAVYLFYALQCLLLLCWHIKGLPCF
jgi:hypothetical protein